MTPVAQTRFGPIVPDPEGVLDLPEGFSFRGPKGRTLLIRNHESKPNDRRAARFALSEGIW